MAFVSPTEPTEPSTTNFAQLVASWSSLMTRLIAENSGVVTLTAAEQALAIQMFARLTPSHWGNWIQGNPMPSAAIESEIQSTADALAMLSAA